MPRPLVHPWAHAARAYHLYPLGCCGAPAFLEPGRPQPERLNQLYDWIDHLLSLGVNLLYLGPLFASSSHGYDTIDYYHLDPRLGHDQTLRHLVDGLHAKGIRVVLDGVFNHVGREFWAFRDLRQHLQHSAYCRWFQRLSFKTRGRAGDPFSYQGWKGHHSLVKLNLNNPEVKAHLFGALRHWIESYQIDGLRMDAADCMNQKFLAQLAQRARRLKPDFWLLGEVVHGDYNKWIHKGQLDSVTNYELYDALHKAHNARNYQMLAHSLQRQFGPAGVYRGLQLYNFVDNHDVTRIASFLKRPAQLYPLHILLYTLPGIPSLYYGSEWGQTGYKRRHSDAELRPAIAHPYHWPHKAHPDLLPVITRLAAIHQQAPALQYGEWHLLYETPDILVYLRHSPYQSLVIAVSQSQQAHEIEVYLPWQQGWLQDLLNPGQNFGISHGRSRLRLDPCWGRILRYQN